jgi:hypothetical protein
MIYFLLSFIIVALVLAYCLARIAHESNDDCMTDEMYNQNVKELPVESDEIEWGKLRS